MKSFDEVSGEVKNLNLSNAFGAAHPVEPLT
jgi:hypothetical protein